MQVPNNPETTPTASGTNDRRLTWLVLIGLVAAWSVFLYYFQPGSHDRSRLGPPQLAPPAGASGIDYRWEMVDLNGKPFDFAQFRGKTLFLNIWATWCPPCVAEMPSIANLVSDAKLKDVQFLCVSVDEDPVTVQKFLERRKLKVPVALAVSAPPPSLQTEGIPATFVIGPDGSILAREIGSARWDDPEIVDRLAKMTAPSKPKQDR